MESWQFTQKKAISNSLIELVKASSQVSTSFEKDNTWEPAENLDCDELVKEFEATHAKEDKAHEEKTREKEAKKSDGEKNGKKRDTAHSTHDHDAFEKQKKPSGKRIIAGGTDSSDADDEPPRKEKERKKEKAKEKEKDKEREPEGEREREREKEKETGKEKKPENICAKEKEQRKQADAIILCDSSDSEDEPLGDRKRPSVECENAYASQTQQPSLSGANGPTPKHIFSRQQVHGQQQIKVEWSDGACTMEIEEKFVLKYGTSMLKGLPDAFVREPEPRNMTVIREKGTNDAATSSEAHETAQTQIKERQNSRLAQANKIAQQKPLKTNNHKAVPNGSPRLTARSVVSAVNQQIQVEYRKVVLKEKNGIASWPKFNEIAAAFDGFDFAGLKARFMVHKDCNAENWYNDGVAILTEHCSYIVPSNDMDIDTGKKGFPKLYAGFPTLLSLRSQIQFIKMYIGQTHASMPTRQSGHVNTWKNGGEESFWRAILENQRKLTYRFMRIQTTGNTKQDTDAIVFLEKCIFEFLQLAGKSDMLHNSHKGIKGFGVTKRTAKFTDPSSRAKIGMVLWAILVALPVKAVHSNAYAEDLGLACQYDNCGKYFMAKGSLKEHIRRKHHGETEKPFPKFICPKCDKTYMDFKSVKNHFMGCKIAKCLFCDRRFINSAARKLHTEKMHKTGERQFNCTVCLRAFQTETERDRHNKWCRASSYECFICHIVFTNCLPLKKHMKTHTPNRCDSCGTIFRNIVELKLHLESAHDPENVSDQLHDILQSFKPLERSKPVELQFKCNQCDKCYSFKRGLSKHFKSKHPEKENPYTRPAPVDPQFKCTLCDRGFGEQSGLWMHTKTKHTEPDVRHECSYCTSHFTTNYSRLKHERTHHAGEDAPRKPSRKRRSRAKISSDNDSQAESPAKKQKKY